MDAFEKSSGAPLFLKPFHGNRRAAIFGVATAAALADGEMADDNTLSRE